MPEATWDFDNFERNQGRRQRVLGQLAALLHQVFVKDGVFFTLFKQLSCCRSPEYDVMKRLMENDSRLPSTAWTYGCLVALAFDMLAVFFGGEAYGNPVYMPAAGFSNVDEPRHGALLTHMGSNIVQRWPFFSFPVIVLCRLLFDIGVTCFSGKDRADDKSQLLRLTYSPVDSQAEISSHMPVKQYQSALQNAVVNKSGKSRGQYVSLSIPYSVEHHNALPYESLADSPVRHARMSREDSSSCFMDFFWPLAVVWASYHWWRLMVFKLIAIYQNTQMRTSCEVQGLLLHYFEEIGAAACSFCVFEGMNYQDSLSAQQCFDAMLKRDSVTPSELIEDLSQLAAYTLDNIDLTHLNFFLWAPSEAERLVSALQQFSNQSFSSITFGQQGATEPLPEALWSPWFAFMLNRSLVRLQISGVDLSEYDLGQINDLFVNQSTLTDLDISKTNIGAAIMDFPGALERLNVSDSGLNSFNLPYFLAYLRNNTKLRSLDVSKSPDLSMQNICQMMSVFNTTSLDVFYLNQIDLFDVNWACVGAGWSASRIQSLYLSQVSLYDEQFLIFLPYLLQRSLKRLDVSGNELSYGLIEYLEGAIENNQSLLYLNVAGNQLDSDDLLLMIPLIRCINISALNLGGHDYFYDALYMLGQVMVNSSIQTLMLGGIANGDYFLSGLTDALIKQPMMNQSAGGLTQIDLSSAQLSWHYMQGFLENLYLLSSLDALKIDDNTFGASGFGQWLSIALLNHSHLSRISFNGVRLESEDIRQICTPQVFRTIKALSLGWPLMDNSDLLVCANALVDVPEPKRLGNLHIGVDLPQSIYAQRDKNPNTLSALSIKGSGAGHGRGVRGLCQAQVGTHVGFFDFDCQHSSSAPHSGGTYTWLVACVLFWACEKRAGLLALIVMLGAVMADLSLEVAHEGVGFSAR